MIRRSARRSLAAGALLVALGLSSCATFDNQRVASVDDAELDQDDLRTILESEIGQQILQSTPIDGLATGDAARGAVTVWVLVTAATGAGLITDDQRASALEELSVSEVAAQFDAAPPIVQDLALLLTAAQTNINNGLVSLDDLLGAARDADISVDSFYGAWDDEAGAVVALG